MAAPNLLTSTQGSDWKALAKTYTSNKENPTTGATVALLTETDKRLPFTSATSILDNGCGPGPITSMLLDAYKDSLAPDCSLLCSDFSSAMVEQVNKTKAAASNPAWSRVETFVSNAMDMTAISSESQSHVLAGWVYFMTPDPQKCLSESLRMLKPGGVLGLTSWKDSQWLQVMSVLKEVCPERSMPELPKNWSSVSAVTHEMELAGFRDVECSETTVYMSYESHEQIVRFLTTHIPPMVAAMKGLSEEELDKVEKRMIAKCKDFNTQEPGRFSGVTLVAVGTK